MAIAGQRFRRASAEDLDALVAIDRESPGGGWSRDAFAQELGLAWSRTLVVEIEGGPAGRLAAFAVYWIAADEVQLLNIAVDARERGRGVGRLLLERVATEGRAAGATRMVLEVRAGNDPARGLYRRLGFVESGVRRGYYGHGDEDAILMEWSLA